MSTEHPLTDEQLDALVDEIQDRLGDSTARKYGRRGVLAALGVAALGTGSASAQASGSVGTSSSPVDVFGYDVDASNSFTDPAGVTHSGELADLSDVGGASGQWQEVNSGANIEPIDGETIGTGVEDVDVGSLNTNRVYDSTGRYLGALTGSGDGSTINDAIADRQSGAHLYIPDPGFELALEETIVLPEAETGFRLETIGRPRFQVQSVFTPDVGDVTAGIRKPEDTSAATTPQDRRDYYIGPLTIDDRGTQLLDFAVEINDLGSSTIEGLLANRCQGVKINDGQQGSARVHVKDSQAILLNLTSPTGFTTTEDNGTFSNSHLFTRCTVNAGDIAGSTLFDWQAGTEHKAWSCGGENFERVLIADGVKDYLYDEGDIDSTSLINGTIEERNGASGEIRLKNSTWGGNGPLWKYIRLESPDTEVTTKGTHPDQPSARGVPDYGEPIHRLTPADSIPADLRGWETGASGSLSTFFNTAGRDPHLRVDLNTGASANNSIVLTTSYGAISEQYINAGSNYPMFNIGEMNLADTTNVLAKIGFAGNTEIRDGGGERAELVYDPGDVAGSTNHGNGNWFFEVETGSTLRGSTDLGTSASTPGRIAIKAEPDGFAAQLNGAGSGGTWTTQGDGGTAIDDVGPRIYWETTDATDRRLSVRTGFGVSMRML